MTWLLDTNVISELRKSRPNQNTIDWYSALSADQYCTSSLNIAELVYGAEIQTDLLKRRDLLLWINEVVRVNLAGRVYDITENILVRWRIVTRLSEVSQDKGPPADLLIAAVALENQLFVATRDTKPFIAAGVPTLNPFTGERFNGA